MPTSDPGSQRFWLSKLRARRRCGAAARVLVPACLGLVLQTASAGTLFIEPSLSSTVTSSTNAAFAPDALKRHDTSLEGEASVVVRGQGRLHRFNGNLAVAGSGFVRHSVAHSVRPRGRIDGGLILVEQWAGIDGSFAAEQAAANPFGARPDGSALGSNGVTTKRFSVSPYLDHEFGPELRAQARSETNWTQVGDEVQQANQARYRRDSARLQRRPDPLGGELEYTRDITRYDGESEPALTVETLRATGSFVFGQQLRLGLIAGRDRTRTAFTTASEPLWGLAAQWRPDERTHFDLRAEHRSFGVGWNLALRHRDASSAWDISLLREPSTSAQSIGVLPVGGNIGALLDAVLSSQYPDPVDRQRQIQALLASRSVSSSLTSPQSLYDMSALLRQSVRGSYALLGARNTFTFSAFFDRSGPLPSDRLTAAPVAGGTSQSGVQVEVTHRLTPGANVTATFRRTRTNGQGVATGSSTRDRLARAAVTIRLSPRTNMVIGARRQDVKSTVVSDADETAVYSGVTHRF